ncbi:30S ribosomal protein S31, mitochondrial [Linum perenne]
MATAMQRCGVAARRIVMGATQQQSFSFSSLSPVSSSAPGAALGFPMLCGRGDKKTKKGKIFKGTYGNSRPKKEKKIERIKDKNEVPRSTPWPLPFKII